MTTRHTLKRMLGKSLVKILVVCILLASNSTFAFKIRKIRNDVKKSKQNWIETTDVEPDSKVMMKGWTGIHNTENDVLIITDDIVFSRLNWMTKLKEWLGNK